MRQEAEKYGRVLSIKIPRPKNENVFPPGTGNVYIEFDNVHSARIARKELTKRLFKLRIVEAGYHDHAKYHDNDFSLLN